MSTNVLKSSYILNALQAAGSKKEFLSAFAEALPLRKSLATASLVKYIIGLALEEKICNRNGVSNYGSFVLDTVNVIARERPDLITADAALSIVQMATQFNRKYSSAFLEAEQVIGTILEKCPHFVTGLFEAAKKTASSGAGWQTLSAIVAKCPYLINEGYVTYISNIAMSSNGDDACRHANSALMRIFDERQDLQTFIFENVKALTTSSDAKVRSRSVGILGTIGEEYPDFRMPVFELIKISAHDAEKSVRRMACVNLLHCSRKYQDLADQSFDLAVAKADDADPEIRFYTQITIRDLIKTNPIRARLAFKTVVAGLGDTYLGSPIAPENLGVIIEHCPDLADSTIAALVTNLSLKEDSGYHDSDALSRAVGVMIEKRPDLTDPVIALVRAAIKHNDADVRENAQRIVHKFLIHRPDLLQTVLEIVTETVTDPNSEVRNVLAGTMGSIIENHPDLTDAIYELVQKAISPISASECAGSAMRYIPVMEWIVAQRPEMQDMIFPERMLSRVTGALSAITARVS